MLADALGMSMNSPFTSEKAGELPAVLLAANEGGHLMELHALLPRLPDGLQRVWVVPDTPQCRSLLAGERVLWGRTAPSRDLPAAVANARLVRTALADHDFTLAISTGSSLAVSALPLAAASRIPSVYVESAARVHGPSVSGRIVGAMPGVRTLAQYPDWGRRGWDYAGSVFDGFRSARAMGKMTIGSMVVSLGTSRKYGFRRLVERLVRVVPAGVEVLWQVGETDVSGLGIVPQRHLAHSELAEAMRRADVVVSHAGVGSALTALELGKTPLLVPRRAHLGEHIDDHQLQIADVLGRRGLAVVADAGELTFVDIERAAATVTVPVLRQPPLPL